MIAIAMTIISVLKYFPETFLRNLKKSMRRKEIVVYSPQIKMLQARADCR